jgi:hypothetical protein
MTVHTRRWTALHPSGIATDACIGVLGVLSQVSEFGKGRGMLCALKQSSGMVNETSGEGRMDYK